MGSLLAILVAESDHDNLQRRPAFLGRENLLLGNAQALDLGLTGTQPLADIGNGRRKSKRRDEGHRCNGTGQKREPHWSVPC